MKLILNSLYNLQELKKLNLENLSTLSSEIRKRLINVVMKNGGHLASNLGVVELTIALHRVFNSPIDKIFFDVSHQSYVHKLLTNRNNSKFDNIRMSDGYSGFSNPSESEHDHFIAGHAGTALSVSLGFAIARDMNAENHHIISVIGDGSLTCGLTFEALNTIATTTKRFILILNDNDFSIDKNVGVFAENSSKNEKLKIFFEVYGFEYIGPIDGRDIKLLESQLKICKNANYPVILHVKTHKGFGYEEELTCTGSFHKVLVENNSVVSDKPQQYSNAIGELILNSAKKNPNIIGITAAMASGTGLDLLKKVLPKQFIDVGIAEGHAVVLSGALAKAGKLPICCIYSTFLQRAFDQIIHDVCLQDLHVIFFIKSGVDANDGATHHGVFDVSYLSLIPNAIVCEPKDFNELRDMLHSAIEWNGPVFIRYKNSYIDDITDNLSTKICIGQSEVIKEGNDICFLTFGIMLSVAKNISRKLINDGVSCAIVNMRFAKPLDTEMLIRLTRKHTKFVTFEDNVIAGGFGHEIIAFFNSINANVSVIQVGWPDEFIPHGSSCDILRKKSKIDDLQIYNNIIEYLKNEK